MILDFILGAPSPSVSVNVLVEDLCKSLPALHKEIADAEPLWGLDTDEGMLGVLGVELDSRG